MDFVAIFLLLIPLIALYVRIPDVWVSGHQAWLNLGSVGMLAVLYTALGLAAFQLYLRRQTRRMAGNGQANAIVRSGRANNFFTYGLAALYFAFVHYLTLKESFERLFFPSEWFILSDLCLLLPFLVPFVLFRASTAATGMRLRGLDTTFGRETVRQARSTAILLLPQLLYLNLYRTIVQDVPGLDRFFAQHPLSGFVVAGTLLFMLFVLSPYFIRFLFARVDLDQFDGGPELWPALQELAHRSGIALDRVSIWLTRERKIANAAVSGLFRRQRAVFLTDHLLHSLDRAEVVGVVAHELGHARFKHLFFNFLLAIMSGVFVIWGLVLVGDGLDSQAEVGLAIVGLEVIYILLVFGSFARHFERQADLYAAHIVGSPRTVASALLKLATANGISVRRATITHPSIHARVKRLAALSRKHGPDLSRVVTRARWGNIAIALGMVALFTFTMLKLSDLPL